MKNLKDKTLLSCAKVIAVTFVLPFLTSCAGTFMTRCGDTAFGAYPYQGVYEDCDHMLPHVIDDFAREPLVATGEVCILIPAVPIDLCLDTVLLPADLTCWCFGYHKDGASIGFRTCHTGDTDNQRLVAAGVVYEGDPQDRFSHNKLNCEPTDAAAANLGK